MVAELSTYNLLVYWTIHYFGLEINWENKLLESKTGTVRHWRRWTAGAPLLWLFSVTNGQKMMLPKVLQGLLVHSKCSP